MKFVCYTRVSTQKQGLGLDAQLDAAQRYAASVGGKIIAIYSEKESGKRNDRPELAMAVDHAKTEGATLLIAKLDRLSRNGVFLINLYEQLAAAGVDVKAADMPNLNTITLFVMAGLAEQERKMISGRTRDALAVLKARGVKLGRPKGVDTSKASAAAAAEHKASADLWAASVLPMIRLARNGGSTLMEIADSLNAQGQKTRRGAQWTATAVRRVLARDIK